MIRFCTWKWKCSPQQHFNEYCGKIKNLKIELKINSQTSTKEINCLSLSCTSKVILEVFKVLATSAHAITRLQIQPVPGLTLKPNDPRTSSIQWLVGFDWSQLYSTPMWKNKKFHTELIFVAMPNKTESGTELMCVPLGGIAKPKAYLSTTTAEFLELDDELKTGQTILGKIIGLIEESKPDSYGAFGTEHVQDWRRKVTDSFIYVLMVWNVTNSRWMVYVGQASKIANRFRAENGEGGTDSHQRDMTIALNNATTASAKLLKLPYVDLAAAASYAHFKSLRERPKNVIGYGVYMFVLEAIGADDNIDDREAHFISILDALDPEVGYNQIGASGNCPCDGCTLKKAKRAAENSARKEKQSESRRLKEETAVTDKLVTPVVVSVQREGHQVKTKKPDKSEVEVPRSYADVVASRSK
ncbi:hypothetical protein HDU86_001221 [Geranomyces michiganensis]|nr:hypothetical protein HDU86_001221 [Geranomyces michiganensis]